MLLVWTDIGWISIEAFSHLEDSCCLPIFVPEVLGYLWDCINSNSIKIEVLNELRDPALELIAHPIVLLFEIWETSEPAVFDLPLVAEVFNLAIRMIMVSAVKWVDLTPVIVGNRCHMVSNNINHNIHSFGMGGIHKILEIVIRTEVVVGLGPVLCPVAMISVCPIVNDRRDPDGIKPHSFDVVEMVLNSFPCTTTIVAEVSACTSTISVLGEPIGKHLIDSSGSPSILVSG
jgi:hypothetical protein